MRRILTRTLALALLLSPLEALAWGWSQPRGAHYLKVWNRSLLGSRAYFADGTARALPSGFGDHQLNYYFEYGLTDRLTLVSHGSPIGYSVHNGDSAAYTGPLQIGARYGLLQGTWNFAVEAHGGYTPPVGERALGVGAVEGRPFTYVPTVETGLLDGELQLGRGIGRGWITAHAGFRWFSRSGLDPVVFGGVQGGYTFAFGLQVSLSVQTHQPIGAVTVTNATGAGQTRYVGFGLDLSYWVTPHWSVTAGVGGVLLAESNAATLPILIGFEHR
jgi:hypothetical protein